ncbi:MAG: hypothetical protein SV966_03370 [Actinomycetota bacterium]|nr:hypothetical protein [Actinomycetota bacterium]
MDLNDGHVDAAAVDPHGNDPHGNVIGIPDRLDSTTTGSTARRDAQVRNVITRLIHLATEHGCASISIENLGFDEARNTGRETMGPAAEANGSAAPSRGSPPPRSATG